MLEGITDGVECKICGCYKYVNSQKEADKWAKNHSCEDYALSKDCEVKNNGI